MTTVHYSLVYCWSGDGPNCSVDKPKTLLQWCSFSMHCSSKGFRIQPHKVQISQKISKSIIYIINYLDSKSIQVKFSICQGWLGCLHTLSKIRLSSHSVRPNKATRSQSLFGYASLRNMIISASKPVAVVPCLQTYLSGRRNAIARRVISSLENL